MKMRTGMVTFTAISLHSVMLVAYMRMCMANSAVGMKMLVRMGMNNLTRGISNHQNQVLSAICLAFVYPEPHIRRYVQQGHQDTKNISKDFIHQRKSKYYMYICKINLDFLTLKII